MAGMAPMAEGMGFSSELMEEMEEAVQGIGALGNSQSTMATQGVTGTQSPLLKEFQRLLQELVQLQMELFAQQRNRDSAGAKSTLGRMKQLENQLNSLLSGQSSGSSASSADTSSGTTGGYSSGDGTSTGDSTGSTSSSSSQPGAGARQVTADDFKGSSATGRKLAALAVEHATDGTGDGGHCYRNVSQDLEQIGISTTGEGAWEAADQLAGNDKVQELKGINKDQLPELPAGAIVVWDKGEGHPYGHISIATGDGQEASDVMRDQITEYGTSFRVFMPKD